MFFDLDSILNSKEIFIEIEFKNGKKISHTFHTKFLKSIFISVKEKEYRKGIWSNDSDEEKNDNQNINS